MRWVIGFLLISAAVLKAAELVWQPATVLASPLGRVLVPGQIGVELALGLLALSGVFWRQLRWLAVVLFTGFAAYSLVLAIGGATSCGCFGPIKLNPWWTFGLDVAVLVGLLIEIAGGRQPVTATAGNGSRLSLRPAFAVGVVLLSAGGAAALGWYTLPRDMSAGDPLPMVGNLVLLEPEEWVGRRLPIIDMIDVDLSTGRWTVLFHRHDCPACKEAVPKYEQLASVQQVALVEVPPYGHSHDSMHTSLYHARLSGDRDWFVQTPFELQLEDGLVIVAKAHAD